MRPDCLSTLFDRFSSGSIIFLDREVLRHEFLPDTLLHREEEIMKLGSMMAPAIAGSRCSNIFLYGKTGTGKTAVARYVTERLMQASSKAPRRVKVSLVNCRIAGTEYRVTAQMCSAAGVRIPFTGLAAAEVFSRLRDALENTSSMFVAVLDEIDILVKSCGDTLLYELTRVNEGLKKSRLSIVGISNDIYFKDLLDPRVLSSLSEEEIVFPPYTAEELADILYHRCVVAFRPNVLSRGTINLCSALAASEHGDARRALDLVRVAGEVAERRNECLVAVEHVREAQRKIEQDRVFEVITTLPLHSKILVCAIYKSDGTTGELYKRYKEFCSRNGTDSLTYRRMSSLLSELNMLGVVSAQISNLGRYGRTKRIKLNVSHETLREIFHGDQLVSHFFEF